MDISRYHELLDLFCEQLAKENPDILDLACGPGNISQYLLQKSKVAAALHGLIEKLFHVALCGRHSVSSKIS